MAKKICMFVTNPVTSDPRVKREAATLVQGGYQVAVIGLAGPQDSADEWADGYHIIRVMSPQLLTTREASLAALKWLSPALYQGLRTLYRGMRYRGQPPVEPFLLEKSAAQVEEPTTFLNLWRKMHRDQLAIRWIFWVNVEMAKVAEQQGADIFHSHDLDTLLAGYFAKRRTGKPLVYDFHELYTEQFQRGVKSPLWHLWYCVLEWVLVKRADHRLTVCDSLGEWVARRYGVLKALTVMNVPNVQPVLTIRIKEEAPKVVLYHGAYVPDRGLECLIESARFLKDGRIVLRGSGPLEPELRALVKDKGVGEVVSFAPPVAMADLVRSATEADIGVIPYLPVCLNNRFCLPNKIFEYMMAGLAIVGSDLPELRRIIVGNDVGQVYDPKDPRDLARALNELLADHSLLDKMRGNALRAAQETFNWANEGQKLLRLYDAALGAGRAQRS